MIAPLRSQPVVTDIAAISSLGADWGFIWDALLGGKRSAGPFRQFELPFVIDVQVSGIRHLEREVVLDDYGAACRLVRSVFNQIAPTQNDEIRLYGGSNHGETDILLLLTEQMPETSPLWRALL